MNQASMFICLIFLSEFKITLVVYLEKIIVKLGSKATLNVRYKYVTECCII